MAEVYAQAAAEMRIVVPPILMHSPAPPVLAAAWMLMREPLMAAGTTGRLAREAVAAAVSVANNCPYCVDVHSTGMYGLATERDAEAIVANQVETVADPGTRQAADWARVAHRPDDPAFRQLAATPSDRAELVGVAVNFHYLNRMVNVLLTNFLPPRLNPKLRRWLKHGISRVLTPTLHRAGRPGRSLSLLPAAPLPAVAAWAAGNPAVAEAVARSYAALEAAGQRALPPAVRGLVMRRLASWRGEDAGLSRSWCEGLVAELPDVDRPAGRLALLTAFASYQVEQGVVAGFRRHQSSDDALIEATAWASFAAARQIGSWHLPAAAG